MGAKGRPVLSSRGPTGAGPHRSSHSTCRQVGGIQGPAQLPLPVEPVRTGPSSPQQDQLKTRDSTSLWGKLAVAGHERAQQKKQRWPRGRGHFRQRHAGTGGGHATTLPLQSILTLKQRLHRLRGFSESRGRGRRDSPRAMASRRPSSLGPSWSWWAVASSWQGLCSRSREGQQIWGRLSRERSNHTLSKPLQREEEAGARVPKSTPCSKRAHTRTRTHTRLQNDRLHACL